MSDPYRERDPERERAEELVTRAVDGALSDEERAELEQLLERFPEYRDELSDFRRIKETTDAMTARILSDFEREPPREPAATRAVISLAFVLLLGAVLVLFGFGGWMFFTEPEIPTILKVAYGAGGLGLLVLFLHVLRLRLRGRDPYEEIDL